MVFTPILGFSTLNVMSCNLMWRMATISWDCSSCDHFQSIANAVDVDCCYTLHLMCDAYVCIRE
jgi:hypothetical protein